MKILIGDEKKLQSFEIPKTIDNFHMINFKYTCNNQVYNETLTLKSVNNESWGISEDEKLKIYFNNTEYPNTILQENLQLDLVFADLPQVCTIYIVPDYIEFIPYTNSNPQITIGSIQGCDISFESPIEQKITITNNNNSWYISNENTPIQKTFINKSSYKSKKLKNGDNIFIDGINIIFLNQYILLNPYNKNININSLQQIAYQPDVGAIEITPVTDIEKNIKLFNEDQLFVHTPQLKNEITEGSIYVEEPPNKETQEKQPILFTLISSSTIFATSALTLLTSLRNFTQGKTELYNFVVECATCGIMLVSSLFLPLLTSRWAQHNVTKKERRRKKKYKKYLEEKNAELNEMLKKQEEILKLNNTPLDQIISNIVNNSNEIWGRQIKDNDFLNIEIGKGNIKAKINITAPTPKFETEKDELKEQAIEFTKRKNELENVPMAYSLINYKIAPFIINSKFRDDYIKSILLQLIYYHSGMDLKIIVITSEENEQDWEFMKYLPHNWDNKHEKRFFATDDLELQTVSSYIEQEYEQRSSRVKDSITEESYLLFNEYYVIVTDNYKLARELPIIERLQEKGNIGFSLVIFEKLLKNLPPKFPILFNINDNESTIVEVDSNNNNQVKFNPNYLENIDIELAARKIANIPIQFGGAEASIPTSLTFLEMFNVGRVEQLNILSRWETNNPTTSLKSIIGFKENNTPVELDLHEKFHGPHGLIAGSTGSGKSEFIISYILSLAVNYHPYEVQFVLIDYKGGGLAGAFENREKGIKIPHLVGTITNLDKSEMNRTLVSINSELQRRQRVFNETREKLGEGTIDIYKYQRLYRDKKVSEPMSHLFIISDEFAELKAQQPEFMDELVSAARIGRSLGIHLILATQKPSGVVDDQIWSNTRFRVCLKVQTPEDSAELLKKPDAAYIKQSGRFYLQVGTDEIYELGQSGWSGAKYVISDTVQRKVDDNILYIDNDGDIYKTVNEETKKENIQQEDHGEQLTNIVNYLFELAKKQEIKFNQLWLPNIPETIYYNNILKKYDLKPTPYVLNPIIGEYDNPANQEQGYVNYNILQSGNTAIAGITGSGKTTLISTIIYDSILNHNTDEVNIYIIDLSAEKLKIFLNAPQIGEVLTINDKDKIKFLFYMLQDEKDRRLSYYSLHGGSFEKDISEGKAPFPNILVIINDFEVFRETFDDIYEQQFGPFTRNCTKAGITFIISTTSFGTLGYNADGNFPKKIGLNLADPTEYEGYFSGKPPIPKKNPGRGVIEINEVPYEFQTSLINVEDQIDNHIRSLIAQLAKYITKRAPKVPVVPDEVTIRTLEPYIKKLNAVPLGINTKTAQVATFNFTPTLNTISARSNLPAKKFFPKLLEILEKIDSTKIMVINSSKDIRLEPTEKTKVFTDNFKDVLKVINTNVNNMRDVITEDQYIIIFVGYYQLQKTLSKEQQENPDILTIDDVIDNSKSTNFSYIVYDIDEYLEKIGDGRLDSIFKRNNGIWLGKEFDMQTLYDVSNPYSDQAFTNSHVMLINNTESQISKFD